MRNNSLKKATVVLLCISMIFTTFTGFSGFARYNGFGNIYYDGKTEIFNGVTYRELIGEHPTNGIEHGHLVEGTVGDNGLMPLVFSGLVRGTYTVGDMVKYAQEQGYKVVAAINGDIYDTSSGTPKGLVIHAGNIVTSGYKPEKVIAFNEFGKASMETVGLAYELKGTISYQTSVEGSAEVQVPVEKVVTVTGTAIDANGQPYEYETQEVQTVYETQQQPQTVTETTESAITQKIDFVNVPHGGAKGLHLYNAHYSTSTKSKGEYVEAVIQAEDIQLGVNKTIKGTVTNVNMTASDTPITGNTLVLSAAKDSASYNVISMLKIGSEIEISVTDTLNNGLSQAKEAVGFYYSILENGQYVTQGTNLNPRSALGIKADGSIVLFELDGRQSGHSKSVGLTDLASAMRDMGCEYAVNLDGGGSSVMYVRRGGMDSAPTRVSSPSDGKERKVANGILLVYKNSGGSGAKNVHLYPAQTLMIPGASATLKPEFSNDMYEKTGASGGVSYSVDSAYGTIAADGTFTAGNSAGDVVIQASSGNAAGTGYVKIVEDVVLKAGASQLVFDAGESREIGISVGYGSHNVSVPVSFKRELLTWSCDQNIGTIDGNGNFTAVANTAQEGNIYVSYKDAKITIPAKIGANIVIFGDTKGHWAEKPIGLLAGLNYLNGIGDNMFAPDNQVTRAQFVAMLAKITEKGGGITIQPDEEQPDVQPDETTTSGGAVEASQPEGGTTTEQPQDSGNQSGQPDWLSGGEQQNDQSQPSNGSANGNDGNQTEHSVEKPSWLAGEQPAEPTEPTEPTAPTVSFSDVVPGEWYYDYVMWGYNSGIVNGMGDGSFQPNAPITREQMAVMLCKYATSTGFILPQLTQAPAFKDEAAMSPWARDYVFTVAGAGIINGFDTGEFMPTGMATRAQAAKVIHGFCELRGML